DDVELCLEVLTRGWTYGFIHQILSFVRNDNDGAFSRIADMDASVACKYFSFLKYGAYLTREEERVAVLDMLKRDYFDRLGRAAVLCRSTAYWVFHRSLFKINGMKLSRRQLGGAAGRRLLTEFARPLVLFARVVQHIKGRL